MAKVALLIGVSEYEPGLNPLPAAVRDVEAMQEVLRHPDFGMFDEIILLKNPRLLEMRQAIAALFSDRDTDDLVLLYFSGHGVTDEYGKFFFTNRDTQKRGRLDKATIVEASFVHGLMDACDSERQVIILDCCHSGAFPEDLKARDVGGTIDLKQQLGGRGRIVLTSSAATEYSFERDGEDLAIYTRYLVEGIRTGAADLDGDGAVSVNELHDYVKAKVKKAAPAMQPERYVFQDGEKILLAKAPISDPKRNYRKEVQKRIKNGKLSSLTIRTLREIARKTGVSTADAEEIEASELKPYQELQQKLDNYREAFLEAVQLEYPISEETRSELQDYQQVLGLRDEDVQAVEAAILSELSLNAELDQIEEIVSLEITPQTSLITTDLPIPSSDWEVAEYRESYTLPQEVGANLSTFSFEVITVDAQGQECDRRPCQAEYFQEALGNNVFLDMVSIPGGSFQMGAAQAEAETRSTEYPQHLVRIAPFYMGKFAITQEHWKAIAALPKINQDLDPNPSHFKGANRPVEQISWFEAVEFCDRLNCFVEGRLSQKVAGLYRLPSEAEWEYACRAGTTTPFHFGKTISTDLANYDGTKIYGSGQKGQYRQQTTDVGSFSPNGFGLYDMHGNVWEWCEDHWHDNYKGAPQNDSAWISKDKDKDASRIVRGGSWNDVPWDCRSATRVYNGAGIRGINSGFRVVCSAPRTL
ncbi:caspase, EACC1-associated type [Phormidesmis sp. 146-33]